MGRSDRRTRGYKYIIIKLFEHDITSTESIEEYTKTRCVLNRKRVVLRCNSNVTEKQTLFTSNIFLIGNY